MKYLTHTLLATCALAYCFPSLADTTASYPSRPIRIIVPFPAGGTIDTLTRIIGQQLGELWHQSVVVENRPGAGGNIGAHNVFTADADGYTLLATPPGPLSINEYLYKNMSFKPADFVSVGILADTPNAVSYNSNLPVKSIPELIAYAKANPGKLFYGSQGNGSTSHLTGQLFATMSGTSLVHVPYKGEGPALTDLMAGRVDLFFGNISAVLKLHDTGTVRILTVAADQRSAIAPEVPSSKEAGLAGFNSSAWFALVAPPNTPTPIVKKLSVALMAILKRKDIQQKFLGQGVEATPATPAETEALIKTERKRWKKVIADAGVKLD